MLLEQSVPATQKRVSMFETHTDTLRKRVKVIFGHKVLVSFGKSGVVLWADVLSGNPADATLAKNAIEQTTQNTGRMPHVALDLGFTSKDHVAALKALGVQRVAFPSGRGIDAQAACGSRRVQRKLYRFRAGVEGLISWLKRDLLMGRSRWKGEQGFGAYIFGVVLTASLAAMAAAALG